MLHGSVLGCMLGVPSIKEFVPARDLCGNMSANDTVIGKKRSREEENASGSNDHKKIRVSKDVDKHVDALRTFRCDGTPVTFEPSPWFLGRVLLDCWSALVRAMDDEAPAAESVWPDP